MARKPKVESEVTELYGGDVTLKFNPGSHRYWANGKPVPSVTTALGVLDKPALLAWGPRMCAEYFFAHVKPGVAFETDVAVYSFAQRMRRHYKEISAEAANIGSEVHRYAEQFALWKLEKFPIAPHVPTNPYARRGVEAFHDWLEQHDVEFLEAERKVYSRVHQYAGTVDFIGRVDGVLTIADYKTSSGWYDEMSAQLAAYRYAYQEEIDTGVPGSELGPAYRLLGLRFDKESGQFEVHPVEDGEADFSAFRACLKLHAWKKDKRRAWAQRAKAIKE